ncbi:hypothetical protein AAVH_09543 [Aphelenchoides avenae]|nr:hypothetical protein AAVH_09543 [Aphelenchus avenae]
MCEAGDYPMALKYISPANSIATGLISLTLNVVLLVLIKTKTPKDMRMYSRILIQHAIVDICYTTTVLVSEAQIEFAGGVTLMTMAGPFRYLQHPWNYLLNSLYILGLFSCVMFLPIQFIYRFR